jgi:hypothetical protein
MARPDHTSRARGERRSQPLPPCCQAWVAEAARSWQVQARGASRRAVARARPVTTTAHTPTATHTHI